MDFNDVVKAGDRKYEFKPDPELAKLIDEHNDAIRNRVSKSPLAIQLHFYYVNALRNEVASAVIEGRGEVNEDYAWEQVAKEVQRMIDAPKECIHPATYYSRMHSNFYCCVCHIGMGNKYYNDNIEQYGNVEKSDIMYRRKA